MASLAGKISFDVEDRPPPSYYGASSSPPPGASGPTDGPLAKPLGAKLDKSQWWKAPEFVPRAQQVVSTQPLPSGSPQAFLPGAAATFPSQPQPILLPGHVPHFAGQLPAPPPLPPHVLPFAHLRNLPLHLTHGMMPPGVLPLPRGVGLGALGGGMGMPRGLPLSRLPIKFNPLLAGQGSGARAVPNGLSGVPLGYSANLASLSQGLGQPPIPAIVLKKKRKKRNRHKNRAKAAAADAGGEAGEGGLGNPEDPSMASEGGEEGTSLAEEEEDSVSTATGDLVRRRSEADLVGLGAGAAGAGPGEDGGSGAGPTDSYDLLQSALEQGTLTMLHGSCPDLSEAQRGLLDELLWDEEEDEEPGGHFLAPTPFDRPPREPRPDLSALNGLPTFPQDLGESDTDTEVVMQRMQRSLQGATSHLAPLTHVDPDSDYELSSAPVFNAIENAASEGRIRSEAVRELDRAVRAEMRASDRLTSSVLSDEGCEAEREDRLFDRLSWEARQAAADRDAAGGAVKSLAEEMAERELFLASQPEGPSANGVSLAAVHKGGPGPHHSVPLSSAHPLAERFARKTPAELFGGGDPMRITVNAFEDPEELVIDEVSQAPDPRAAPASRLDRLRSALKARLYSSGYRPHHTPLAHDQSGEYRASGYVGLRRPDDAVCCALM